MSETPDFNQLGIESPYSAREWRRAWVVLEGADFIRAWQTVVDLVRGWQGSPTVLAGRLVNARDLPLSITACTYYAGCVNPAQKCGFCETHCLCGVRQ